MNKHVNRRIFLRGLGGAVVAAPFLSSVAEREAKAQSAAAATPTRLIAMFTHYGCVTTRFFPKKSHGALTAADLTGTTLEALSPYVDKLLIPRGIRAMNEWTATMARGQGNDPHTQVAGTFFTCQPVAPNSDSPFDFDQANKNNAVPIGPSLDHVIAQQMSPKGTPLLFKVGGFNDTPMSAISYSAAKTGFPGYTSPSQVFSDLTNLFKTGQPMSADTYAAVRGKSILDLVADDLATLERFDMSAADKAKLEAWKALLSDTGAVMASAQCSQDLANTLGATSSNVSGASKGGGIGKDNVTAKVTDTMDAADVYAAVTVLSAACNYNPVALLKFPPNYVFSGLGLSKEAHGLSHRIGDATMMGTCVAGVIDMLQTIDKYYAAKFANLIKMLSSIKEGDGTLLDHSAAVWFQEMSDGNAHNLNNLPIIQAGSAGGYFKTGWTVNVEDGSANLSQGQSESECATANDTVDGSKQTTGTDPKIANAPINKYYCNLMNAMGVKAGADGFPAKGGSAEVTHFGMYDNTADFIGGGTKPAKINKPGEFTELKANS